MIARLVRREFFSREGLTIAIAATLIAPLMLAALMFAAANTDLTGAFFLEAAMVPVLMFRCRFRYRATPFEAALPIPGRDLFLARAFSNVGFVWLPLPVLALGILLRQGPEWSLMLGLARGAAALSLMVVLPLAWRVQELSASAWMVVALCAAAVAAGGAAWYLLPPGVMLAVFALATVWVIAGAWRSVPRGFQVAPRDAVAAPKPSAERRWRRPWSHGVTLILRRAVPWQVAFLLLFLMLMGPFVTGFYFITMFAILGTILSRERTCWMQTLPLSYRTRLAVTLAATVLPLVGASVAGLYFSRFIGSDLESLVGTGPSLQKNRKQSQPTNVPLEYWRHASGGKVPSITAAWGETAQPQALSIWGFQFYNPYFTDSANSPQFVEWQLRRATGAVNEHQPRVEILGLAALLSYALLVVWLLELGRWHWLWRPGARAWRVCLFVLIRLSVFAAWATEMFQIIRHSTLVLEPLAMAAVRHFSRVLPDNLLLVVAVAALAVTSMYAALEWQFRRTEVTGMVKRAPGW